MSLKPLRLLSTFCWYSLWGLRRQLVLLLFLFFWVLNCRNTWTPHPFWLQFGSQPALFLFLLWLFPGATLQGALAPSCPFPQPHRALLHTCSYSLHSKMWCFFLFCFVVFLYCFCFEIFPFLLRLCPEKTSFACVLLFLHTFVYITFTSLFSIVCAKTDRFKRVSKKLF